MDEITKQDKEQILKALETKKKKQYNTGKVIVIIIVAVNIISALISAFTTFNFIALAVQLMLSLSLFFGVVWVRYFFAIGSTLSAFLILYALMVNEIAVTVPTYIIIFALLYLVYCIISSIVLISNKSVSEFLYTQRNG